MQTVAPGEGEPITALHASLDGSMLAMQRSSAFLQFVHIRSSKMFVQVSCCYRQTFPVVMTFLEMATAC